MSRLSLLIFAGPSLPTARRPAEPRFGWRPPASSGDLIRLVEDPPHAVCLIDGYFDSTPSVWHKEILLLMEAGVAVFGGASMGALRAAELDRFGMIGIGAIYRLYRSGRIEGDDEVALVHAPEELDWRPLSEPLVDVRATLSAAIRQGALSRAGAGALLADASSLHYGERSWAAILSCRPLPERQAFAEWLPCGKVRLKERDALRCLAAAAAALGSPVRLRPLHVPRTCFIERLAADCGVSAPRRGGSPTAAEAASGA
ncbi:TfuA-like protein [Sphingosinicella sp. CPCC 101087]|uniref:TfuA-like protein n=1 Tax=Sphingosinicella sp. CPCC 101087 TaxID=2497754 RepID=UPI00101DF678|nr:TfuA-like protein [Sphingosinicella sp. CPCC 101087]